MHLALTGYCMVQAGIHICLMIRCFSNKVVQNRGARPEWPWARPRNDMNIPQPRGS